MAKVSTSPSKFEHSSLSTKCLVEPQCLVDSAEAKNYSCPRNGLGPEKALGGARNSAKVMERRGGWPEMERALLSDERVLKEIQSTLERDQGHCGNWPFLATGLQPQQWGGYS